MSVRSKFEVLMDVLTLFYDYNSMNISTLMRKGNISILRKKEIVDLLLAKGLIGVNNNNFLFLTDKGQCLAGDIVPKYKSIKKFYLEGFDF